MALFSCNHKCSCTLAAIIASAVIGVLAAFFQITGVIAVVPVFLWVAFGIAIAALGVLLLAAALDRRQDPPGCTGTALDAVLAGILGTVLLGVILLAVGIVATSVVSAILVGLLLFFFTLMITGAACLIRALAGVQN